MRISLIGVAKLAALGLILALVVLLILWARAKYTIEGRIYVEEGSAAGPARHVEVRLINKQFAETVTRLAQEYERNAELCMHAAVTQLAAKVNDIPATTNLPRAADGLSLDELAPAESRSSRARLEEEHPDVQRLVKALEQELGPLTDEERKEVSARVRRYLEYSLYCREAIPAAPLGARFYERAAHYWEERAEQLKKTGRVIIDDVALSYVTEWLTGGLGDEPVQRVSRVSRTNEALRSAVARAQRARSTQPTPPPKRTPAAARTGGVLPNSSLTSNELLAVVTATQRELQRLLEQTLRTAEEGLLDETLDLTTTDDDGRFVFRGDTVQPGEYLVFAKYDIVSLEGEPLQLMWFEPLTISMRRFAFDKSTRIELTEINQRRPAVMELRVPSVDELRATLLRRAAEAKALSLP